MERPTTWSQRLVDLSDMRTAKASPYVKQMLREILAATDDPEFGKSETAWVALGKIKSMASFALDRIEDQERDPS